jgi:hypothetical protein
VVEIFVGGLLKHFSKNFLSFRYSIRRLFLSVETEVAGNPQLDIKFQRKILRRLETIYYRITFLLI